MSMTKPTSEQVTHLAAATGAILRNVSDKLGDLASVKDFGAVGNGTTDDTAALQAAFNYATDNGKGLFFPGGTYRVTSTIVINQKNRNNLFLGDGGAIIRWYGSNTATDMIRIYNAFYPTFQNLRFQGLTNTTLVNCRGDVLGFPRPDGKGARNATFVHCEFTSGKYQLRWTTKDRDFNNEQATILHCYFGEYRFAGISIEHSNSLWHRIYACEFIGTNPNTWCINTMDDQGGNEYDPTYTGFGADPGFGGSGMTVESCNKSGQGGFLRLGGMRYPIWVNDCLSEGSKDWIYTPTGKQTFTASVTSGNTTVTNVSNVAQLSPGDYFWNKHVPIGTKIASVDVGTQTVVLDTAPTGTQSNSVCDAGINTNVGGQFQLYMRNVHMQWSETENSVNPLIAFNTATGTGSARYVVNFENTRFSAGTGQQPMFLLAAGIPGFVEFHDFYGEPAPFQVDNCIVSTYGRFANSGKTLLTASCRLFSQNGTSSSNQASNCFIDGGIMYTQMGVELSTMTKFMPSGNYRILDTGYPASPTDITAISGVPVGYQITIRFGGQLTLKHSAALSLSGGVDIRPPSGGSMVFVGTSAGVFEVSRDFNTYRANVTETAANIASISSAINTAGKYAGKVVWDTTNTRLMRADGSAANSAWRVIDGSASVTPS